MSLEEFLKETFSEEFLKEAEKEYKKYKKSGEEMEYYDYGFLLNALGFSGDLVEDEEIDKAKEFLLNMDFKEDVENALIIKEWLIRFADLTYVQGDKEIAMALSRIEDPTQLICYFANNFTNFWC